jgi:hypothetical protein
MAENAAGDAWLESTNQRQLGRVERVDHVADPKDG